MGEGSEGPEFWRRPGPQWILKDIPGQPSPTHPDLSGQVGVQDACSREGTCSLEPRQT